MKRFQFAQMILVLIFGFSSVACAENPSVDDSNRVEKKAPPPPQIEPAPPAPPAFNKDEDSAPRPHPEAPPIVVRARDLERAIQEQQALQDRIQKQSEQRSKEFLAAKDRAFQEALARSALEFEERSPDRTKLWEEFQKQIRLHQISDITLNPNFLSGQIDINAGRFNDFQRQLEDPNFQPGIHEIDAAITGYILNEAARTALENHAMELSARSTSWATVCFDVTLDLIPTVGAGKGLVEAASGYSILTGEHLSVTQRTLALSMVIPYGAVIRGIKPGLKALVTLVGDTVKTKNVLGALAKFAGVSRGRLSETFLVEVSKPELHPEFLTAVADLETRVTADSAVFRKIQPEKIYPLQLQFQDPAFLSDVAKTVKDLETKLGLKTAYETLTRSDPFVTNKVVLDISQVSRLSASSRKLLLGSSPEAVDSFIAQSQTATSEILLGKNLPIAIRLNTGASLEAVSSGLELSEKTTFEIPYSIRLTTEELERATIHRKYPFILGAEEMNWKALTTEGEGVTPILKANLDSRALDITKFSNRPVFIDGGKQITWSGRLKDEALVNLKFKTSDIEYRFEDGSLLELGKNGDKFLKELPSPEELKKLDPSLYFAFRKSDNVAAVNLERVQPGQILVQVSRAEGGQGRWYGIFSQRPRNPKDADELYAIFQHLNDAKDFNYYVVTERTAVYAGPVEGGRGSQIFFPAEQVLKGAPDQKDVLTKIKILVK